MEWLDCSWPLGNDGNASSSPQPSTTAIATMPANQMTLPPTPTAARPQPQFSVTANSGGSSPLQQHRMPNDMMLRIGSGDYACGYCGKNFVAPAFLRRHIRSHTGEKPFKCPHCDFRATQKGNLNSHIINRHNSPALHSSDPQSCSFANENTVPKTFL